MLEREPESTSFYFAGDAEALTAGLEPVPETEGESFRGGNLERERGFSGGWERGIRTRFKRF
jgi:hypothetical protein